MAENTIKVSIETIIQSKQFKSEIAKMVKTMENGGNAVKKTGSTFGSFFDSVKSGWLGIAAGAAAAFAAIKKAFDLTKNFAEFKQASEAMETQFGVSSKAIIEELKKVSDGTISAKDAVLASNRAMALGVTNDIGTIGKLYEIARVRARALGTDTTQAFNDIVTGIGRGSPLILDNLGIITTGWEKEAKAAGVSYDKQFILNKILQQGADEIKKVGKLTLTTSERFQVLSASMEDIKLAIGEGLSLAIEPTIKSLSDFVSQADNLKVVRNISLGIAAAFQIIFQNVKLTFTAFATLLTPIIASLKVMYETINGIRTGTFSFKDDVFGTLAQSFKDAGETMKNVIVEYKDIIGNAYEKMIGEVEKAQNNLSNAMKGNGVNSDNASVKTIEEKIRLQKAYYDFMDMMREKELFEAKEDQETALQYVKAEYAGKKELSEKQEEVNLRYEAKKSEIEEKYRQERIDKEKEANQKIIDGVKDTYESISSSASTAFEGIDAALGSDFGSLTSGLDEFAKDGENLINAWSQGILSGIVATVATAIKYIGQIFDALTESDEEKLEKEIDATEKAVDRMEKIDLARVNTAIDNIEKEKEAYLDAIDEKIDALEEQRDATLAMYDELSAAEQSYNDLLKQEAADELEESIGMTLEKYNALSAAEQKSYFESLSLAAQKELLAAQADAAEEARLLEKEKKETEYNDKIMALEEERAAAEEAYNEQLLALEKAKFETEKKIKLAEAKINLMNQISEIRKEYWAFWDEGKRNSLIAQATADYNEIAAIINSASYAKGTEYVPKTGFAYLHEGERVVPRAANALLGGVSNADFADMFASKMEMPSVSKSVTQSTTHTVNSDHSSKVVNVNGVSDPYSLIRMIERESGINIIQRR